MGILAMPLCPTFHYLAGVRERIEKARMRKQTTIIPLGVLNIDPTSSVPLYRQLYSSLRHAILSGLLGPGTQLPSTRSLASELGLARGTVANAFAQLVAEGYLEGRHGGGTYVAHELPDDLLQIPA